MLTSFQNQHSHRQRHNLLSTLYCTAYKCLQIRAHGRQTSTTSFHTLSPRIPAPKKVTFPGGSAAQPRQKRQAFEQPSSALSLALCKSVLPCCYHRSPAAHHRCPLIRLYTSRVPVVLLCRYRRWNCQRPPPYFFCRETAPQWEMLRAS